MTVRQAELIRSQLAVEGIPRLVRGDEWSLFSPFAYTAYAVLMTARILRHHRDAIDDIVRAALAEV